MLTNVHPKLPMRSKKATLAFYIQLGFAEWGNPDYAFYLMIQKNAVQIHFFEHKSLNPKENYGQAYIRTNDIESWYAFVIKQNIAIHPSGHLSMKPWGIKEFSILDPDYNLITFGEAVED